MSPKKRKLSRSPEGASHQRKALRNDSISTANDSRKNSNATANIVDASADPRQNRGAAATIRSPVSTDGSTYQDATSSRSTPRPTANMQASSAMSIPHDGGNADEADNAEMNPLLKPLSKLMALVSRESSTQVSHKLAKIQSETATSHNQNMKTNFSKFPSIEERLKKEKFTADQEVKKLESQLRINTNAQPELAKSLAAAFLEVSSKAEAARRVSEVSPDAVSREEFNDLHDRFIKQHDMLEKQQDLFAKQQDLVDQQQQHIDDLHTSHAEAKEAGLQARQQANTTERDMIRDLAKLDDQLQNIESIATERHGAAMTQITERLDSQSNVLSQLSNTVNSATDTGSGTQKGLARLEERLTATKKEVGQIGANEQRAVTQRLEKYDQKLDDLRSLVESLRSENARIHEDLAQKAQKAKDAPEPVAATGAEGQAAAPALTDALMAPFMARVEEKFIATEAAISHLKFELNDDAEGLEDALSKVQNAQGNELAHTKEQLASLAQKVGGLEEQIGTCSSGIEQLEQTTDQKHAQTGAAYDAMRDAVAKIQGNLEMLQAKTTSLSDNVAALEKRPVATAQTPASSSSAQDALHFTPMTAQSPRAAANSRSNIASGQTNGVQSPRNPASPLTPFGFAGGASLPRDLAVLTDQVRGMVGTVTNIKQRIDNLTSDVVVQQMVDQFSHMYPAAKDFQVVAGALQAADARLESRLEVTDAKVGMLQGVQNELRSKLDKLADSSVEERTTKVEEAVTELREDVKVAMNDARVDFDAAMGLQNGVINDVRHQVEAFAKTAFQE
jgi:chromosome segregation ATPase